MTKSFEADTCFRCGKSLKTATKQGVTGWIFSLTKCKCDEGVTDSRAGQSAVSSSGLLAAVDLPRINDDWTATELIGEGGMSRVYKAVDKDGKTFAVKVLRETDDANRSASFSREIETASTLDHPNLVAVYSNGTTAAGNGFAVMDYIPGKNLADLLVDEVFIEEERAINIFVQICEGLAYAHSRAVAHLDLKPSNVLVTGTDVEIAKIVDFGIARIISDAHPVADTEEIVGSLLYMSPEQCRGDAVDSRSDIYSLGCLMYEVLTGRAPFIGENPVKTIMKHLQEQPKSFRGNFKRLGISTGLETIVMHCLEKNNGSRYQYVEELLKDLDLVKCGKEPLIAAQHNSLQARQNALQPKQKLVIAGGSSMVILALSAHLSQFDTLTQVHHLYVVFCSGVYLLLMGALINAMYKMFSSMKVQMKDSSLALPGDRCLSLSLISSMGILSYGVIFTIGHLLVEIGVLNSVFDSYLIPIWLPSAIAIIFTTLVAAPMLVWLNKQRLARRITTQPDKITQRSL